MGNEVGIACGIRAILADAQLDVPVLQVMEEGKTDAFLIDVGGGNVLHARLEGQLLVVDPGDLRVLRKHRQKS